MDFIEKIIGTAEMVESPEAPFKKTLQMLQTEHACRQPRSRQQFGYAVLLYDGVQA